MFYFFFFFCTGNSSSSEKMDQLQLPEGFRPDYKPKYVFYILKKTLVSSQNDKVKIVCDLCKLWAQ